MNLSDVDWKSLEKTWGFLFKDSFLSKMERNLVRAYRHPEELVILVSAYEKFEGLIQK